MTYKLIDVIMTSNNTPSPYVVSGSNSLGGDNWWAIFDNNNSTFWHSNSDSKPWVQIKLAKMECLQKIVLRTRPDRLNQAPVALQILGSNDGITYSEVTNLTNLNLVYDTEYTYEFNNTKLYLYYKFQFTSSNTGYTAIGNITMYSENMYILENVNITRTENITSLKTVYDLIILEKSLAYLTDNIIVQKIYAINSIGSSTLVASDSHNINIS